MGPLGEALIQTALPYSTMHLTKWLSFHATNAIHVSRVSWEVKALKHAKFKDSRCSRKPSVSVKVPP